ncbi:methionine aminotransferase [Sphingobacterium rhinopitheci]|uniref:methionine aminotransferase n=1 Tax=Sphingobacterium rhinopitheci TaxID=2781960 RepID=UPI001F521694|nr:methionine aminotransferase [Sphingobacterium rhinopitheci]
MTKPFHDMPFKSKLPNTPASIFSRMSALAQEHQAINLSQGFPDFDTDPKLIEAVTKYMNEGFNQYAPMPGHISLREQISFKYDKFYGINVNPADEITITAGGTQGLFTVISAVVEKGDEVIIFEPAYDSYKPAIELMGAVVVPVRLMAPDFKIDWEYVRSLVNSKTKLIIINNPNNPTGRVFSVDDIQQLEYIVSAHNIVVLSDEVYEHMVYDVHKHISVLSSEILRSRSFVVCSFGKLLHTTGWKLGYVIAPAFFTIEFRKVHQFNVFSVNAPMQLAIASYLDDIDYYYSLPKFFQEKKDFLLHALKDSRFNVLPTQGTYFMLLDYSNISEEQELDFAERLTIEHKLAMIPVSAFYTHGDNQQLLRICFAKKLQTLTAAVDILKFI